MSNDPLHLERIPKGIEKFFPHLIGLRWSNGFLTTVTAEDLQPFPDLQIFYVYNNKIVSIDGDLFKNNPKLNVIYFHGNLLENIGSGLLDGLDNLVQAFFNMNSCIDMEATSPSMIEQLKLGLRILCSSLEADKVPNELASMTMGIVTTSGCSIGCIELIEESVRQKVEKLNEELVEQNAINAEQSQAISELRRAIEIMAEKVASLEVEIRSKTCC